MEMLLYKTKKHVMEACKELASWNLIDWLFLLFLVAGAIGMAIVATFTIFFAVMKF